jgi:hypothetical protein
MGMGNDLHEPGAPGCSQCGRFMSFVGTLPRVSQHARLHVFACKMCRSIAQFEADVSDRGLPTRFHSPS